MKREILNYVFAIVVVIVICIGLTLVKAYATNSEDYIPSDMAVERQERVYTDDENILLILIDDSHKRINEAHNMAEAARGLDYDEQHSVIQLAKTEWEYAYDDYNYYQSRYNEVIYQKNLRWANKEQEYPVATAVWRYLTETCGYNNYVAAGILGNMMAECGGQTLNLNEYAKNPSGYYGLCQWGRAYKEVQGADLSYQLDFLNSTLKREIDTYGYAYKKEFDFNEFLRLTNEKSAARAFAKCYERCGSGSYKQRERNATEAYNYFTN